MKTKLFLTAFLGLVAAGAASAASADKPAAPIEVTFIAPEKFTDVKDDAMGTDRGRDAVLGELKEHLVTQAAKYMVPGQQLEIKVTDVDLAGDFEPWRGPNFNDIRIVKDIYPPRVDLEFRLLGADGKVVSEGKRQLRNPDYLLTVARPTADRLRYEKEMLSDWLRQEFKRAS
ncbi:Protein of unknown function [Opitutus sp. GAS368]|jgi:hypothetical protein|nr:Protein of unknown function [Opitutus sp. GAS368]